METVIKQIPAIPPKLALINDLTGFGRCSLAVAVPVVSIMKVQPCPVPTSVFSNHMGFPHWAHLDLTSFLGEFLEQWEKQELHFEGICCGFLSNEGQTDIIKHFLSLHPESLFILDPVMGDHGRLYSSVTAGHCEKMKELASLSHLLTPNITEACILTGIPYKEVGWTETELCNICDILHSMGPEQVAITGIREDNCFINFISRKEGIDSHPLYLSCKAPIRGNSRPGTGDIFAAIVSAGTLRGWSLEDCVKKAASFIGLCTEASDLAGLPIKEGVFFELYLHLLGD